MMLLLAGNKAIKTLFFGNYFYGLCAIALSVEASLQQRVPLNEFNFYILTFCATVLYYSKAYLLSEVSAGDNNIRSAWYAANRTLIRFSQWLILLIFAGCGAYFIFRYWPAIVNMGGTEWLLIFIFPFTAVLYYGDPGTFLHRYNLRNIGWLKPFIIGFTWAGLVTVYPVLYYDIQNAIPFELTLVGTFLFLKNFMYVTLLCIMFDIKDYDMDYNQQLKTFVVKLGLRKTVFFIIIPLCFAGLGAFIGYAISHHFHPVKILLNTIPFILVLVVAYSLHMRHTIFYYLVIIDGLMLVKALCGITAMIYF